MALELTEKLTAEIDAMSYQSMLSQWRFAPAGTPMFQHGPVADYFAKVMARKRGENPGAAVAASKSIGWGR